MQNNKHIGSSFDDFLAEQKILEEVEGIAMARVIAWQIQQAMKEARISKKQLAERMHTSRTQVDRLLDPRSDAIQLDTLRRAATAIGHRLKFSLEPI